MNDSGKALDLPNPTMPKLTLTDDTPRNTEIRFRPAGVNDYFSKDGLPRLVPPTERELAEAENRRVRWQAERERRIIFEIIQGTITTPNLDEFLKLVHRSISQIVYAENCFVMLHDPANDTIHFEFWVDKHDPVPPPRRVDKGFSSYVLRTGQPLLLTSELEAEMYASGAAQRIGSPSPSWLGVPLRTPTRTIGVLVLQHYENEEAYTTRDLEFLSSVGDQIAIAIERKRAEEALTESEVRYRDLVENAIDIIYTHDLDGNYTSVNRAAENITGYSREEAMSMNLAQTVAPEYLEKARSMIAAKLTGEEVTAYEVEIIAKDGRRVAIEVNTRIIYENGTPVGVQGIARDITERKHLEDKLRQSHKMEAIGLLAGGIAHDFNNLLTAITGYSNLTLRKMPVDDPLRVNIKQIKDAGDRAAALTSQLLAFSRKQVLKPRVHNLNSVITEVEGILRRIIRENVVFETDLAPKLGNIKADPGQIEQVIINLVVNARDAMPMGGNLTIKTQNVRVDMEDADQHLTLECGRFVKMTIADTGQGIDMLTQSRIFEPFFTTKEVGKGTGLGLSTAHGIVKQSGGDIKVFSEVGCGTAFEVYLPCVDEAVEMPKRVKDVEERHAGVETILLVEDEDIVRKLVSEILTNSGYTVLEAASGKEALDICDTYSKPVQMLLTDVVMPDMGGSELTNKVIAVRPDIKVLFMSGYTDDLVAHGGVMPADIPLIEKPFTPDGLARRVRDVLGS